MKIAVVHDRGTRDVINPLGKPNRGTIAPKTIAPVGGDERRSARPAEPPAGRRPDGGPA